MKFLTKITFLAFLAMGMLSSCTLSEPSEAGQSSTDASKMLLKQVSLPFGFEKITFEYDSQNRITKIDYFGNLIYEINYESNGSNLPSYIKTTEYGDNGQISCVTECTDLKFNSQNYLIGYNAKDTDYPYQGNPTYFYSGTFEYSDGHMVSNIVDDESQILEWKNGDLITNKAVGDYVDSFSYSDVANIAGQWDPANTVFGPIACTGWFGKAPAHFMKSVNSREWNSSESETTYYSYKLLSNGLISKMRLYHSEDDYSGEWNYSYIIKK